MDTDGSNGWSAGWDSTGSVDGSTHSISAVATDTIGQTNNDSINVTVNNAVAESASVDSIGYATEGGKNQDKHLLVTIALIDNLGNPVSGASVSIELYRDGAHIATGTDAITGSSGTVTYSLKNADSGTYTTVVTAVSASGLTWDGATPENSFDKTSSSNNNSKNQK